MADNTKIMKYILIWIFYEILRNKLIWLWYFLISYNDRKSEFKRKIRTPQYKIDQTNLFIYKRDVKTKKDER